MQSELDCIIKNTQQKYISFHRQLQSQHRAMEMTSRADVTIERGETRDFNVTDSLEVRKDRNTWYDNIILQLHRTKVSDVLIGVDARLSVLLDDVPERVVVVVGRYRHHRQLHSSSLYRLHSHSGETKSPLISWSPSSDSRFYTYAFFQIPVRIL